MYEWCHTGLEGYCKSAAKLLDDFIEADLTEEERPKKNEVKKRESESALHLCQDLLPDRNADNISRTWTFSNERKGRGCRLSIFEKCWLGQERFKLYTDEAKQFARVGESGVTYQTIPHGSSYERELRACTNDKQREHVAVSRREMEAIDTCVENIMSLMQDDEAEKAPFVVSLMTMDDFPVVLYNDVNPAIERGLLSERYGSSDIQQFLITLNGYASAAYRYFIDGEDDPEHAPYRRFFTTLVAGIIYGPTHPRAIDRPWNATQNVYELNADDLGDVRLDSAIRVTQLFDSHFAHTGHSDLVHPTQVVFLGRSPKDEAYIARCKEVFVDEPELLDTILQREAIVFPFAHHEAVGNVHAVLLCRDDDWWLYDLETKNGTSIVSEEYVSKVNHLARVQPGDQLRLGAPPHLSDANVYLAAATVLVSQNVKLPEKEGQSDE